MPYKYIMINECSPLQGADYVGEGGNDGPQNTDTIKNSEFIHVIHRLEIRIMWLVFFNIAV